MRFGLKVGLIVIEEVAPLQDTLHSYDYELPREFIAQHPPAKRDSSRLLVLDRADGRFSHRHFSDLLDYLKPGDVLVLNDSKVIPAKVIGRRATGGRVVGLFIEQEEDGSAEMMLQSRGRLRVGDEIAFADGKLVGRLVERKERGIWQVDIGKQDVLSVLDAHGRAPLPPYIKRPISDDPDIESDRTQYQTVYARISGSIAAPTAGLHFTEDLIRTIENKGIKVVYVTLHVGLGTFLPVRTEHIPDHDMLPEAFSFTQETADTISRAKAKGRRVIAVGTSTVRVLEHIARKADTTKGLKARSGKTGLYIYPPFEFRLVDALLTNFHLPKSTNLVLVSAFAGWERILAAYEEAKRRGYRFYSFGDAMLIL